MSTLRDIRTQLYIAGCLYLGNILCGYTVGWSAPVLPKLQNLQQSPLNEIVTISQGSWIGSTFNIGVIIGPNLAGYIANTFGRKRCIFFAGIIMACGYILLLTANHLAIIFAGRILNGIAAGILTVINILYMGEITSAHLRGVIMTCTGIFFGLGTLIVYSVGPFVSYSTVQYFLLVIGMTHLLGSLYIPESPVYHFIKGKEDKSLATLLYLGRSQEIEEIRTVINKDPKVTEENDWKWHEIFTNKINRRSFFISFPILTFQQCSGMLAVGYFTTNIFQLAGSSIEPAKATIVTGATQFLGTLLVPTLIENAGRKVLLAISSAGCGLSLMALGAYFYLQSINASVVNNLGWLPLASLVFSFFSYSIGLNIIPNAIAGELFCPNIRSVGSSLALTLAAFIGFVSITAFGYVVESFGIHVIFWIFAGVNFLGFIFSIMCVPETKGLSLSEIQIKLSNYKTNIHL